MRVFRSEEYMMRKLDSAVNESIAIQRRQDRYNFGISLIKTVLNTLLNGGIYIYLISRYSLGLVALSSFTMYLLAVSEFYGAVDALFFMFIDFYKTNLNLDELRKFPFSARNNKRGMKQRNLWDAQSLTQSNSKTLRSHIRDK